MREVQEAALTGAFIAEGLHEIDYDNLLAVWDKGCIELLSEAVSYVPIINALMEAGYRSGEDYSGVFHYDVTAPFGRWFAEHVINSPTGDAPARVLASLHLYEEVQKFFLQDETDQTKRAHCCINLMSAFAGLEAV